MIDIRKSDERGHANHGWLDSHFHLFRCRLLRSRACAVPHAEVMNDDRVAGGGGFPKHPPAIWRSLRTCWKGALEHKDSMGNGSVIKRVTCNT